MKKLIDSVVTVVFVTVAGCSAPTSSEKELGSGAILQLDVGSIEKIVQMKGIQKGNEYKVTIPQNDLDVVVDSFRIIAPMGLGSWVAFTPAAEGVMIMGDLVVTEADLKPVQEEVIRQGLTITAIHNHFLRDKPHVMYMHISGMGAVQQVAQSVKNVFEKVRSIRGGDPAGGPKQEVKNTLDTASLNNLLGSKGEMSRGVFKHTIGRPDVTLKDHASAISSFAGFNTWAAWQGTPERAAVAGDFAMLEEEVAPVIKALVENGIEVVAVHNHMVHEQPRIFFLHYWGVGPIEKLSKGLKAALDQTQRVKSNRATATLLFPPGTDVLCKN